MKAAPLRRFALLTRLRLRDRLCWALVIAEVGWPRLPVMIRGPLKAALARIPGLKRIAQG